MAIKAKNKRTKSARIKSRGVASKKPQAPRMKLTKGQIRKRNALRKSLGNKIADQAFSKWMKAEKLAAAKKAPNKDAVAKKIVAALKSLSSKKINFGTYGYTIKRAKGKGAQGLVVTKNVHPAKGVSQVVS